MAPSFYIVSRDLGKCDPNCPICYDSIPSLKTGPVKLAAWAYKHNKTCLHHMQEACPSEALMINPI